MIYTVKRIEEDLDFGCEERPKGMPVMAIVTLTNSSGEEIRIKAEDAIISAIDYVAENFNIQMEKPVIKCIHSDKNNQCIKERCPFHE